ncbi:PREDICTED: single Ig IL-1-related receptor [Condylura cristata]|uniref:single Ig IL-1-related receptor n=1 Tax=Condylura cristata TaxID=143302 RepID=UPI0006433654|nr:PREDICTED: single Ig IL-1-related receptor [Condylura cristata]
MAGVCDRAPGFLSPPGDQVLQPAPGSVVALNCTAWVDSGPHCPPPSVQWLKDGQPLGNGSHYSLREDFWLKPNLSEGLMSSVLGVNLTGAEDYGVFACCLGNFSSASFVLRRAGEVTPSSDFWKELQLALPRRVQYGAMEGDPQTQMQDDKDPMLIVRGHAREGRSALGPELDPDPEGDLGVRGPVFGGPAAPLQVSAVSLGEGRGSETDVSDLGSRNYGARTDFYCLVSKDDV